MSQRPPRAERDELCNRILDWVVGHLHEGVESGWARIDLTVMMAANVDDYRYVTLNQDGSVQERQLPLEHVRRAFGDVRELVHEEGKGTWFSGRLTMNPSGRYSVEFNYDVDPVWWQPLPPEVWAKDLEMFPRDQVPRWLRQQLGDEVEPPRGLDHVEYAKLVSLQVRQILSPGWTYAQVHFREVGGHAETNALVRDLTGRMSTSTPPRAVAERFRELRALLSDGPNAWYSARLDLEYGGKERLMTNRVDEPQWITPPPAEAYQEELRRAGGSLDVLPTWLRAELESR